MNKKRAFRIVVIGSGLPSPNFIDEFLKKKKNIDVISPNFNYELEKLNNLNKHLYFYIINTIYTIEKNKLTLI